MSKYFPFALIRFFLTGQRLPEQVIWLELLGLLLMSALAGLVIFGVCRYYYRDLTRRLPLAGPLIPTSILATLLYYQNSLMPGMSVLLAAALAVIYFRPLIKSKIDFAFVSWAVLSGLLIAVGPGWPVLLADLLLAGIVLLLLYLRERRQTYLLLIRYDKRIADQMMVRLRSMQGLVSSQKEQDGCIDLVMEVRLRHISLRQVEQIAAIDGVHSAVMVSQGSTTGQQD